MVKDLMKGKKGLVMGVANDHSIAWGMAEALHQGGGRDGVHLSGGCVWEASEALAESIGAKILIDCDVQKEEDLDRVFATLKKEWGTMDFLIHAIAYSNKDELQGHYVDTTLSNFLQTMHISCYSFTSIMRRAKDMMKRRRVGGDAYVLRVDESHAQL
jgi:enoyl-[acyl-carrier protein] reductase I